MKRSSSSRVKSKDFARLVAEWCSAIDCARSLTLAVLFRNKEYEQIANLECNPADYPDRVSFHKAYLATKFLSKFDGFGKSSETRAVAIQTFLMFEQQCADTNAKLRERSIFLAKDAGGIFHAARVKIDRLLGDLDSSTLEVIFENSAFGPGVTTSHKGKWLGPHEKFRGNHEITAPLNRVLEESLDSSDYPSWLGLRGAPTTFGNTVVTVPKNSKTDRTIAVEPGINAFFQRGVGVLLRSRLRRWGVNLQRQDLNRNLAQVGSLTGAYATIDLKGASDTISSEVVQQMLPSSWVKLLEVLRSHRYKLDGEMGTYHKHSSMGNGYTFELESLIFASIVKACLAEADLDQSDFRVYGDDIIVPTEIADRVIFCLTQLGFTTNISKTFTSGLFRESCGGDFYSGVNVTPFYYRKAGSFNQVITFANWLRGTPLPFDIGSIWRVAISCLPRRFRVFGPVNSSYLCIHVKEEEYDPFSVKLKRRPYGPVCGFLMKGLLFKGAVRSVIDSDESLAATLYLHEKGNLTRIHPYSGYRRESAARELGRWHLLSYHFCDSWEDPKFGNGLWIVGKQGYS